MTRAEPTWQEGVDELRRRTTVPAALANAVVLVAARSRWQHTVVARTSMHDLLFTLPGDDYPFDREVRVSWSDDAFVVTLKERAAVLAQVEATFETVDRALDALLVRLVGGRPVCGHCGREVVASAEQFETFERMHYVCFHYLFEHDPTDPDEECFAGGCPSANLAAPPRPRP
jgi:hypothetical protein